MVSIDLVGLVITLGVLALFVLPLWWVVKRDRRTQREFPYDHATNESVRSRLRDKPLHPALGLLVGVPFILITPVGLVGILIAGLVYTLIF